MLLFEIGTSALDTELLETFVLTPPPLDRLRRYSLLCFDTKHTAVIIVVFLSVSATACREYISELGLRLIRLCQWLLLWATRTGHAAPAAFRPGNRPGRRRAPTPRPGPFVGIAAAPEAKDRFHLLPRDLRLLQTVCPSTTKRLLAVWCVSSTPWTAPSSTQSSYDSTRAARIG